MKTKDFDRYIRRTLDLETFQNMDSSLNGLQVDNSGKEITKAAFAVDACLETIERAAQIGANLLFVHHGLFWGRAELIVGLHRKRIQTLLENDLALYAVHLPLDQDPRFGNNAGLAALLGLKDLKDFGIFGGKSIGYKGKLPAPLSTQEIAEKTSFKGREPLAVLTFGSEKNETVGIVSGGGGNVLQEAIADGLDLFLTGEIKHEMYHLAREAGINIISGGHYATEVWGVRSIMQAFGQETGIESEFIDAPTAL